MKFFKKPAVAITIVVLVILACSTIGLLTSPSELPDVIFNDWIQDDAGLFSQQAEYLLEQLNSQLDKTFSSVMAVATVPQLHNYDIEDAAFDLAEEWGLGDRDMLLLIDKAAQTYYLAYGSEIGASIEASNAASQGLRDALDQHLSTAFFSGQSDDELALLISSVSTWYDRYAFDGADAQYYYTNPDANADDGFGFAALLVLIVLILLLSGFFSGMRRRRRYGTGPIFIPFWMPHCRHHTPPPGPHNDRGPHHRGGGGFGGRGGGFSGGGGFGGRGGGRR